MLQGSGLTFTSQSMRQIKLLLVGIFGLIAAIDPARAQTWTPTSAPLNFWEFVACSADCSKIIVAAVNGGPVLVSTNSGAAWITNTLPNLDWDSVATTADGSEFLVGNRDINALYMSTNSGATWISNSVPLLIGVPAVERGINLACSADGTTLAVSAADQIASESFVVLTYISTNSGQTWFTNNLPASQSVALSADGSAIIVTGDSYICISTNYGLTWTNMMENQPNFSTLSVACSANASTIVVGSFFDYPGYISTNFGVNWTSNSFLGYGCTTVASSADGSRIEAVNTLYDMVYTSTNFGVTWTTNNLPVSDWWAVASSADGNKLVATAGNDGGDGPISGWGPIYTWYAPPSPHLNLATSNGDLCFSWLVPSTNMVLQENLDLTTTNWVTVTNTPTLNFSNLQYQITLSPGNTKSFYRLATP
jgi:hypothetical protein